MDALLRDVSIRRNHRHYREMDRVLMAHPSAVRSHWFAAAACVTHPRRGLGALDGFLGRLVFSGSQVNLLRFVHAGLFTRNCEWFEHLRRGELPADLDGLTGRALDHALVDAEQRLFTRLMLVHLDDANLASDSLLCDLSERVHDSPIIRSRLVAPLLREALRNARSARHLDMACEADRCGIGHDLVDLIRRQRGVPR